MNETKANLTLKQRRRLQGNVQAEQKQRNQTGSKELPLIAVILVLLLAFGGGTALGMIWFRPDPRLQELADMEAIIADQNTPNDVRGELMGQTRELAEELPATDRQRAGMGWGDRMSKFFTKSGADQLAQMQAMVAWQKEREAEREAEDAAKSTDASKDNSNSNNNGNGGGKGGKNDQQRTQQMEQRLANRPPEQRSQGTLFRQMLNAVRQTQGLSAR